VKLSNSPFKPSLPNTELTLPSTAFTFDSIDTALADLKAGRCIVVVDDENRENEGDLVGAAQFATPDMINFMAVEARGLICLAMTGDRLDQLDLPLMVTNNTDSNQTAFTVSIDAGTHLGVSTGISAEDRARTIQVSLNPSTTATDLRRPGHIFPIRAREGGVLKRAGHTEAAVDLAQLAGLYPAGVICEIQNPDGSMARLPELIEYAHHHGLKLISIADLIQYRLSHERFVYREAIAKLPSQFGNFQLYGYRNGLDNSEHLAIVKGEPVDFHQQTIMVRVHSECLTGDALGSLRCDCRLQLQAAMKMIEHAGQGVIVYLRQEGRGIGLLNKLKAYSLQDMGLDTVEANERLGFPADLRNYGVGAQILNDLGVQKICLITNNPRKIAGLRGYGLEVVERVPLLTEATSFNSGYLSTKVEKLGHLLRLQTHFLSLGIHWQEVNLSVSQRYERLQKLRQLVKAQDLFLQEEVRPVAIALFNTPALSVQIGLDQIHSQPIYWYQQPHHPYGIGIQDLLIQLMQWSQIQSLEFLISSGTDPFNTLQGEIERYPIPSPELDQTLQHLKPQRIYTWHR
jgi:3,4-dihydroxy 2-butanone 4-phosphate synthase / GTP cyclohydrolase II